MTDRMHYKYVIVGGGIAGASAIEGIRARDREGGILLVSSENHAPYKRPLLSGDLWYRAGALDDLPVFDDAFYREQGVEMLLRREVVELQPEVRTVWDDRGVACTYDRLLLATGCRPRELDVGGAHHPEVHYFRSLEDYLMLERRLDRLQHALVIGGEVVAVELAAALRSRELEVTFVYPHEHPLAHMLPRDLGARVADRCRRSGIETVSNEAIVAFEDQSGLVVARTRQGNLVTSQMALVAAGSDPQTSLAEAAGLEVGNGIEVDEYARASDPNVYAAGDVAEFPHVVLGCLMRVEHWDHSLHHGRAAGANMAGANRPYTHIPMFSSRIFDLSFETVGDADASFDTDSIWREEREEGVVFYLNEDVIRGVLLWNVEGKADWARGLLRTPRPTTHAEREAMVLAAVAG
jgi:3-phenylpropionate/trans-cinnamate dioxygenase ferredoxin reductase subunit